MMKSFENMSDEDLAGLDDSAFLEAGDETPAVQDQPQDQDPALEHQEDPIDPPVEDDGQKDEGEADAGGAEGDDKEGESPKVEDLSDADHDKQTPPVEDKPAKEGEPAPAKKEEPAAPADKSAPAADKPAEGEQELDYKAELGKLIGVPIKANGKEITLKNTDEVIRLVQQGAGYAQKMEQLKPARKLAAMMERAGLLGDENAYGQMIDLYNGDPKAIAKLVKDLKIDIFALDLDAGDQYTPTSHLQTDEAVNFTETLKEVRTLEGGREALALIDSWDQQSKDAIWGNAQAVRQIFEYKQSGVYDTVATEVERRRTLGQIPVGTPFIHAFQQVGDEMAKAAEAASPSTPAVEQPRTPPVPAPAKPVARTPIASGPAPRKAEAPDARAAAAASPRVGGGQAKQVPDIYSLSDKDIENMSSPPA